MEDLYTEDEAAAYLKIERKALARLRRTGRIAFIQVTPRRHVYTKAQLQDYVAAQAQSVRSRSDELGGPRVSASGDFSAIAPRWFGPVSPRKAKRK